MRKVSDKGTVQFKGQTYPIGKALKKHYVALRATTEGTYAVYYCTRQTGKVTLRGAKNG